MRRPPLLALLLVFAACGDPGTEPVTTDTTGDSPGSSTSGTTSAPSVTSTTSVTSVTSTTSTTSTTSVTSVTSTTSTTSATSAPGGCLDPRVGWRAELVTYHHDVTGTAEIRDDCTIVVTDFNYDGTGLDVRFYGGKDGDYAGGFALSDDLLRPGGYSGETLVLTLPGDRTLDDLDGLSVWCVDVGIDFGSGQFAPP